MVAVKKNDVRKSQEGESFSWPCRNVRCAAKTISTYWKHRTRMMIHSGVRAHKLGYTLLIRKLSLPLLACTTTRLSLPRLQAHVAVKSFLTGCFSVTWIFATRVHIQDPTLYYLKFIEVKLNILKQRCRLKILITIALIAAHASLRVWNAAEFLWNVLGFRIPLKTLDTIF